MRLRYFNDWVKLERMAVLPKFRHTLITGEIINLAFEIARRKGYRQCYGQAQTRLLGFWKRLSAHPAYDALWQDQALDKAVAAKPSTVPTLWLQGLWDQEDMYGAIHSWEALKAAGHMGNNHLVMGPWYHSQVNRSAENLGPLKWNGDTAADFRKRVPATIDSPASPFIGLGAAR